MATEQNTPVHTAIRIDGERWRRLKLLAEKEDRSLAAILRRAVDRELERDKEAA